MHTSLIKKLFLFLFAFQLALMSLGQNYIYKGDKQYSSTQTWWFTLGQSNMWGAQLGVCVAISNNGGYMMLSVGAPNGDAISGNVYIILNTGELITLSNRVNSDYSDEKSEVLYFISHQQLEKLKSSSISKIKFFVKGATSAGMNGNHTASNIRIGEMVGTYEAGWNTAIEITELGISQ